MVSSYMSTALNLFFLFSLYGSHTSLHSFPTRRSSDLLQIIPHFVFHLQQTSIPKSDPPLLRSEEHTSELQSLRHLVCRLLLEKKKIKFVTIRQAKPLQTHESLSGHVCISVRQNTPLTG